MCGTAKASVLAWALCGAIVLLAGCPAGKDQSAAQSGVAPGEKIAVTPQVTDTTPTAPPAPPPSQELTVTTFAVTGMTCDHCSASIEAQLIKLPGVTTVAADYKTGVTKVQYDPQQSPVAELLKAIESLGFKAQESSTSTAKTPAPIVDAAVPHPPPKRPGKPATPAPGAGK